MLEDKQPKPGLRERKKLKTRTTIQHHALLLFREQGYHGTTVEQIAEAAEISPSTFFRYFPTKEALIFEDDYDPLLIEAFKKQPLELTPMQALRRAIREGMAAIPEADREDLRERLNLALSVPELRAASIQHLTVTMKMIAELMAARVGRELDDFQSLTFAGCIVGAMMSVQLYCFSHPEKDYVEAIDQALEHLEAGLSFPSLA